MQVVVDRGTVTQPEIDIPDVDAEQVVVFPVVITLHIVPVQLLIVIGYTEQTVPVMTLVESLTVTV